MGELFTGDSSPFGYYYKDAWDEEVSKMKNDLVPIIGKFIGEPATPEVLLQLRQAIDGYFATQCLVSVHVTDMFQTIHPTRDVQIGDWEGGIWVTPHSIHGIIDCRREGLDFGDDYTIDYTLGNDTMDEALEATLLPEASDPKQEKKTTRADDVLFEPIDLEKERSPKPTPVYDESDYGCYD